MNKTRLEAFSDGVIAIIITIMVLELKVPEDASFEALRKVLPFFMMYALSYVNIGIYWNNHHHMLQATRHISGKALWPNLNLLFWLSLFPFVTRWMGEKELAPLPTAAYGLVALLAGVSYTILQTKLVRHSNGQNDLLAEAVGGDLKGKLSMVAYTISIPLAWVNSWVSLALFVAVAIMWFVPDRRIESRLAG